MAQRFEGTGPLLVRTKVGIADDADVANPAVAITGVDTWATTGMMQSRGGTALKRLILTVTFRDVLGAEVAGTFDAYAFAILQHGATGETTASQRRKVQKLSTVTTQPSSTPMSIDCGRHDDMGLRLFNIAAVGATHVYVTAEEWDR